ncbi:MAG: DsrE family protein [Gammaproteobacteria bacterium]|nr:DsrE family protein [Gammaproteobacteria bacterium]
MNNLKSFTIALMAFLTLGFGASLAQAADKQHKAVYHLNSKDIETQQDVLRNAQNHLDAIGADKMDLRIVMHAGGVSVLRTAKTDVDLQSKIESLKLKGVRFEVCKKTLDRGKIDFKKDLYDVSEKDIVPSGVAEIALLQEKGFSYVKP